MSRPASNTVKAGHSLTSEAGGITIITCKSRLYRTILRLHTLEESTLTIIKLIGTFYTGCTEIPGGAKRTDCFTWLADLFEVVRIKSVWAFHHAFEPIVIETETSLRIFCTSEALIIFWTVTRQTLYIARETSSVDNKLTFLTFRDAQ